MKHLVTNGLKIGVLLTVGMATNAIAQTAASGAAEPPQSEESSTAQVEDIVVTAQKRSENLQNVPIAITALSADTLTKAGVTDVQSLQIAVPGLAFAQSVGFSLPRIRGVGTGANGPGVENSVAVYVDNVYIAATSFGMMPFNNVAQLAVLKGPQGTLFGRNATGGVIQITTRDPGRDVVLDAATTLANYWTLQGTLYAAIPLRAGLSADVAIFYKKQNDGFARNLTTGHDVGQGTDFAIRSKVKWEPTDTTTVRLIGDYSLSKGARPANRLVPGSIAVGGVRFTHRDFAVQNTFDPRQRIVNKGVSLQVNQSVGDLSLMNITAYRRGNFFLHFDPETVPAPAVDVTINQYDRQFSEELQLLSPEDGRLTWMLGVYYLNASSGYHPQQAVTRTPPFVAPPTIVTTTSNMRTRSIAGFGQATFKLDDFTNITAGLRYTADRREGDIGRTVQLPSGIVLPAAADSKKITFKKLTWRLALDHRFSQQLLGYVSYNRGFKSGLFDPTVLPLNRIEPEVLDAYEAGVKADMFDRTLRINAALFHYIYKNIQVVRIVNGLPTMLSGPKAKVDGADVDATVNVTSHLRLTAGLSWVRGRFTKFPNAVFSTPLTSFPFGNSLSFGDAAGKRLPMTPDWTANLGANYTIPTRFGDIALDATWSHNDGYFEGPENRIRQAPFNLVNSSVTWTSMSGKVSMSLWAKNLFDQFYGTQFSAQATQDAMVWGERRTFGATLRVSY